MLPFVNYASVDDEDPYRACHTGFKKHPHYHDCEHCAHAEYLTCDYGKLYLLNKMIDLEVKIANRTIDEINDNTLGLHVDRIERCR